MNGSLTKILLNTAAGFKLSLPPRRKCDEVIRLTRQHAGVATRNSIRLARDSDVCMFLLDLGNSSDDFTEIELEKDAAMQLIRVQIADSTLTTRLSVKQHAGSCMNIHYLSLTGEEIMNYIDVSLEGEHAELIARGITLTNGAEHATNKVRLVHASPECSSHQFFRNILADKSHGSFEGRIVVKPHAQQTEAYQRSSNILLSDDARMTMMPHLEIYADDVKCSHGATAGQLNSEALFYLRSRGLSQDDARKMLLQAFVEEVLDGIDAPTVREEALQFVNHKLLKINLT